ncbi:MAG: DNA repair protein RecO [Phycisphaerales bacterium]|nr:DNA repair protein RecO [Phycisphaerales bacterium]
MQTLKSNAICVRHWDFSETSQTVSLFTRELGLVRGLAKGARRERGSFSGGIDLLTRGEVVALLKPGRDLATLTAWDLQEVFWSLRRRLAANQAGLYMADLVNHFLSQHDPHPALFDALVDALRALEDPTVPTDAVLLRFQWDLLHESGYLPELAHDADTGAALPTDAPTLAFSPGAGGLVADTGSGDRWRIRRETVDMLRALAADPASRPVDVDAGVTVERASRLLAWYLREILGDELPTMRLVFRTPSG